MEDPSREGSSVSMERNVSRESTQPDKSREGQQDMGIQSTPEVVVKKQRWENLSAWLLLLKAFMINAILAINWSSNSLYYEGLTTYFHAPRSLVGWIWSLQDACDFFFAIFVPAPMEYFPPQYCTAFGAVLFCGGFLLSTMVPSVPILFITLGFIPGLGLSFMEVVPPVVVHQLFYINRSIANGILFLGFSFGNVIGPPIMSYLIHEFGWRGSLLIHAGLCLNLLPLSLTIKSPPGNKQTLVTERKSVSYIIRHALDFSLLKNPAFTLLFVALIFSNYHSGSLGVHFFGIAKSAGVREADAAYMMTWTAITGIIFRCVTMCVGNIIGRNRIFMMTIGFLVEGLGSLIMLISFGFIGSYMGAILFGAGMGIYNTCKYVVIVDVVGVEKLAHGIALVFFSQSFSFLAAAPMTGLLYDVTGSYIVPLQVAFASCMLAVVLLSFASVLVKFYLKPAEKAIKMSDIE